MGWGHTAQPPGGHWSGREGNSATALWRGHRHALILLHGAEDTSPAPVTQRPLQHLWGCLKDQDCPPNYVCCHQLCSRRCVENSQGEGAGSHPKDSTAPRPWSPQLCLQAVALQPLHATPCLQRRMDSAQSVPGCSPVTTAKPGAGTMANVPARRSAVSVAATMSACPHPEVPDTGRGVPQFQGL